jgi:hypothetical protein
MVMSFKQNDATKDLTSPLRVQRQLEFKKNAGLGRLKKLQGSGRSTGTSRIKKVFVGGKSKGGKGMGGKAQSTKELTQTKLVYEAVQRPDSAHLRGDSPKSRALQSRMNTATQDKRAFLLKARKGSKSHRGSIKINTDAIADALELARKDALEDRRTSKAEPAEVELKLFDRLLAQKKKIVHNFSPRSEDARVHDLLLLHQGTR